MAKLHPAAASSRRLPHKASRPRPRPLWPIVMVAALGTALSAYVWYLYATTTTGLFCAAGAGCDPVREGEYARLLGVPLPALGTVAYLGIVALAAVPWRGRTLPLVVMAAGGVGLPAYLTWIEVLVLRTFCIYCAASAVLSLVIAALVAANPRVRRGGRRFLVIGLGTMVAVAALAVAA